MIADSLFLNASVFTADTALQPDSVAVRGGVITYVGRGVPEGIVGPSTEIVDARGGSLLRGFIDAHVQVKRFGKVNLAADCSK